MSKVGRCEFRKKVCPRTGKIAMKDLPSKPHAAFANDRFPAAAGIGLHRKPKLPDISLFKFVPERIRSNNWKKHTKTGLKPLFMDNE
jgi:hypothetical protein